MNLLITLQAPDKSYSKELGSPYTPGCWQKFATNMANFAIPSDRDPISKAPVSLPIAFPGEEKPPQRHRRRRRRPEPGPDRPPPVAAGGRRRPALPDLGPALRARARNEDRHGRGRKGGEKGVLGNGG